MSRDLTLAIYVFILATFVGFEVIARVPAILHTPLMSATNAIHGIVLLGAMLVAGFADTPLLKGLAFVAVVLGAANVFGGFAVTERMLDMFKQLQPGQGSHGTQRGHGSQEGQPPNKSGKA